MNLSLAHSLYRYARLKFNNALIRVLFRNKQPKKKYFLAVCAIFKNEGKFFTEWLNYYLLAGVDHFYLYNNFSDDNYLEILQPYIDKGFVTLIDWPVPFGQYQAYQDCVRNHSAESNWIGFFDLDEFVVPIKTTDLKDVLKKYNKFPTLPCFWKMFGSGGIMKDNADKLVTEQFVVCGDLRSYKSFLNTKFSNWISLKSRSPHFFRFKFFARVCPNNCAYYSELSDKKINLEVQLNHYYSKSYEFFYKKKIAGGSTDKNVKYSMQYFFDNERIADHADYRIYKYLVQLKTFDLDEFCAERAEQAGKQ